MSKISSIKHRLHTDPDGMFFWADGGYLPTGVHETTEVTGLQRSVMLEGHDDVYIIVILPGDEDNTYDAWLRRAGCTDMVHIVNRRAHDPEDLMLAAMENMPEYIGLV